MTDDTDFQTFASLCLRTVDNDRSGHGHTDEKQMISQMLTVLGDGSSGDVRKDTEAVASFLALLNESLTDEGALGNTASLFYK